MSTHESMSHADAAWLRMDSPTNLMVINSLMFFEETPDWDRLRANHVERIVDRFPRFRQIARPGGPLNGAHWEDDPQFDPDDHFHRIALPAPHDVEALRALVGDLATAPLDHGRPLWDVYLIEDFGSGAVLMTRSTTRSRDGIALARVMLSATDDGDPGPGIAGTTTSTTRRSARSCTRSCDGRAPPARRRARTVRSRTRWRNSCCPAPRRRRAQGRRPRRPPRGLE